ncbi:MAG: diacylglycerol kinase [Betaproteobacteria bacterium]|nr:diacylglycerol kinase [Betaproteobacteria bacterium]
MAEKAGTTEPVERNGAAGAGSSRGGPAQAEAGDAGPVNGFKGVTGVRRLANAARYSMDGFRAAYRHEEAFRQEVWVAAVLVPLALLLPGSGVGRALMIGSVLLVLMVELLNSAIEATVDRISGESHPLAKQAKDIGSAAVFVALANAAVVWGLVLFG